MLPRIYLWLAAGMLPLGAQTSLDDGGHLYPRNPPTVQPAQPAGPATLHPGGDTPKPEMPAPPRIGCHMKEFTISPSTVREGEVYQNKYGALLRTTIVLNVPAPHRMVFHVVSSDRVKAIATDVVIIKDATTHFGGIDIRWHSFQHDSVVEFKAYSEDDPDTILHARLYLKKKLE